MVEQADGSAPRGDERHRDRQGDQQHHPGPARPGLRDGAGQERRTAPHVHDGAEHRGDPPCAGEAWDVVADQHRELGRERDHGHRDYQVDPEQPPELADVVAVPTVPRMLRGVGRTRVVVVGVAHGRRRPGLAGVVRRRVVRRLDGREVRRRAVRRVRPFGVSPDGREVRCRAVRRVRGLGAPSDGRHRRTSCRRPAVLGNDGLHRPRAGVRLHGGVGTRHPDGCSCTTRCRRRWRGATFAARLSRGRRTPAGSPLGLRIVRPVGGLVVEQAVDGPSGGRLGGVVAEDRTEHLGEGVHREQHQGEVAVVLRRRG